MLELGLRPYVYFALNQMNNISMAAIHLLRELEPYISDFLKKMEK
jgi:hypothetical protein